MATYGDCVNALRGSLSHLEGSVSTLGAGVADFPRLANVLKTVRVSRPSAFATISLVFSFGKNPSNTLE